MIMKQTLQQFSEVTSEELAVSKFSDTEPVIYDFEYLYRSKILWLYYDIVLL
jgi:hypothetical protein